MKLPLTKVAIVDIEGLGLEARWDKSKPIYFVGILEVNENGNRSIRKYWSVAQAIDRIKQLSESGYLIGGHNFKFDLCALHTRGLPLLNNIFCTMVMEYTKDSSTRQYSLDYLTGEKTDIISDLKALSLIPQEMSKTEFWATDWSNDQEILEHIADYCVGDIKATWTLYKRQAAWYNLPENEKFADALFVLEFPMIRVLSHMEHKGIGIDEKALVKLEGKCRAEFSLYSSEMQKVARHLPRLQWKEELEDFIPFAKEYSKGTNKHPRNVCYYLDNDGVLLDSITDPYRVYDHCELLPYNSSHATGHTYWLLKQQCEDVLEKADLTPKGKPKLNKDFFAAVADELPDNLPIAKYLKATKNLQIVESIGKHVRYDGIHCTLNNCLTRTGRLSAMNPNLQNIPRDDGDPESIASGFRQLFVPRPGKIMLCADLDRIELVTLAWYLLVAMKDSGLADVCNEPGSDVHQYNADKWKVTRSIAKTLIFLLVYGGGAGLIFKRGMAKTLEEAEEMVAEVDRQQPAINRLKESVWQTAEKRGYVTNPFNARGVYKELKDKRKWLRGRGQRQSFNYLIQRTARDIMHMLCVRTFEVLEKYGASLLIIVHDECVIECDEAVVDTLKADLADVWNNRWDILPGVRINGDWNTGANWLEAKHG